MTLDERLNQIEQEGTGGTVNRLVSTVEHLSSMLKSGPGARSVSWVPDGTPNNSPDTKWRPGTNVPANTTDGRLSREGKAAKQTDVGEGLDYDEEDPEEGAEGRIKSVVRRGKAKKPNYAEVEGTVPVATAEELNVIPQKKGKGRAGTKKSLSDWQMRKAGPPMPTPDDDDEDDGPAYDEDSDDEDYGDDGSDTGGFEGADEGDGGQGISPRLADILQTLEQNPRALEMLEQFVASMGEGDMGGGGDMGAGMAPPPSSPPPVASGGGAPVPTGGAPVPPHTHDDSQQFQRSVRKYSDALVKAMSMDPRAEQLADAIDASTAIEALAEHFINGFSRSLARIDELESIVKSMAKTQRRLERTLDALGEVNVEIAKSLASQNNLVKSVAAQPTAMPNPGMIQVGGMQAAQGAGQPGNRSGVPVNKEALQGVLYKALGSSEGQWQKRVRDYLIKMDSSAYGAQSVIETMPDTLFNEYRQAVA